MLRTVGLVSSSWSDDYKCTNIIINIRQVKGQNNTKLDVYYLWTMRYIILIFTLKSVRGAVHKYGISIIIDRDRSLITYAILSKYRTCFEELIRRSSTGVAG